MSGETWTEYTVRFDAEGSFDAPKWDLEDAERRQRDLAQWGIGETTLVGRTVTASDWLPVNTDGAK